jgi:putative membrane protein
MKKIIFIVTLWSGLAAQAQIPQPDPDTTARHFLIVASINNLQEVSAGEIALQKSGQADVKAFGGMMVKEHGGAEQKLLQLAKSRSIGLPTAATGGIRPDLNLVNAGPAFDRLYVHAMVAAHRNAIQTFEAYTINGKDPAVRAFAREMLPALRAHFDAIKDLDEKIKYRSAD